MRIPTSAGEVRSIEAAAAPTRYARGWHCLGLSERFRDGKPHAVNAFGQKLVVFAGADGRINVLDAYCRYMGGDLSQGTVKGDEVACPFHDWRWGGDGRCKRIPYSRRVPLRARTASWPTLDQDGMLFVWNGPEGGAPPEDVAIPRIEGAGSDEWTDWLWHETVVHANCREGESPHCGCGDSSSHAGRLVGATPGLRSDQSLLEGSCGCVTSVQHTLCTPTRHQRQADRRDRKASLSPPFSNR